MTQLMISARPFAPGIMARPAMYALLAATIFGAPSAFADVPLTFNYQGKAFTPTGAPLSGNQTMWFKILHKTTPTDPGTIVYAETAEVVLSPDGVVNHAVGTGTPAAGQTLEPADYNAPAGMSVYLSVAGGVEDNVLLPHTQVQAVPMAVMAEGLSGGLRIERNPLGPNIIGGAASNQIAPDIFGAVIAGGVDNHVYTNRGVIGGGSSNNVGSGPNTTGVVGGGADNNADGYQATIPGGAFNRAGGIASFAAGRKAKADHAGSFVFNGYVDTENDVEFHSRGVGTFNVRALGGAYFSHSLSASVVEVRGADVAEGFDQTDGSSAEPGTVMVIDEANPGNVKPSATAYDRKVAGIISGAGGVRPGLKLTQDGVADGNNLIAMAGRVYAKVSAENGSIAPGDLLTTSNTAGHAMKATDTEISHGAVIGKAMTELKEGTGLVLVLVNLQ